MERASANCRVCQISTCNGLEIWVSSVEEDWIYMICFVRKEKKVDPKEYEEYVVCPP
ncbi:MAG: hypothetical protein V8T31_10890 [Lachnospiraceae bacterium]